MTAPRPPRRKLYGLPALCPGCARTLRLYARGLCQRCYRRPELRALYQRRNHTTEESNALAHKIAHGGHGEPAATDVKPGSLKVAVLEARALAGTRLWNDDDAKHPR